MGLWMCELGPQITTNTPPAQQTHTQCQLIAPAALQAANVGAVGGARQHKRAVCSILAGEMVQGSVAEGEGVFMAAPCPRQALVLLVSVGDVRRRLCTRLQ